MIITKDNARSWQATGAERAANQSIDQQTNCTSYWPSTIIKVPTNIFMLALIMGVLA